MPLLIAVMGTTASGKTELAEALADELRAQLINNDAFQIYRGMDAGTAKSSRKCEYELVDIRDPDEGFGVGEFVSLASRRLADSPRDHVFVGGTGLYIRALFDGYTEMAPPPDPALRSELNALSLEEKQQRLENLDPEAWKRVDQKNPMRVQRALERALSPHSPQPTPQLLSGYEKIKLWLHRDPLEIESRIATRAEQMVAEGWVEEVGALRQNGYSRDDSGLRAHGYRHIWDVLEGKMKIAQALELTTNEVRRYAKRQRTWLRKEPGVIRIEADDALRQALREIEILRG
jgi:tRNA dimethylallyltransferase